MAKKKTVKKKVSKVLPEDWYLDTNKRPNYIQEVRDFHIAFGHPHPKSVTAAKITIKTKSLRIALNIEECLETLHALSGKQVDLIGLADGLADLIYVVAGAAVVAGINTKNYTIWTNKKDEEILQFRSSTYISSLVYQLNSAIDKDPHNMWADSIQDVISAAESIAISYNIPLWECFMEVQKSNMSKLGKDGKPVLHTSGPKEGKVIKGPNFREPNLKKILKKHGTIK